MDSIFIKVPQKLIGCFIIQLKKLCLCLFSIDKWELAKESGKHVPVTGDNVKKNVQWLDRARILELHSSI